MIDKIVLILYLFFHFISLLQCLRISSTGFNVTRWSQDKVWAEANKLSAISQKILMKKATEMSYSGKFIEGQPYHIKTSGIYVCAIGGLPLFRSEHKFVSGTGWPSFYDVYDPEHIEELISPDMKGYTEVLCRRTGCHIGHCYPDKPSPALARYFQSTGQVKYLEKHGFQRYCVNAGALRLVPHGSEFIYR